MSSSRIPAVAQDGAGQFRKPWTKPRVVRIVAGAAEAITRDGQPDGGGPGQSRS